MNLLNSKIIVAKNIKMDRELKNVIDYTPQQLLNLMSDEDHLVASDNYYSFIRTETNLIQTHFNYDQILNANYIAFQNSDYSNKWFFAFIDEVIFKGPANTEIRFTVDSFSTFNKDLNYGNSYVIREHVNDDTIGANTVPENIDVGEIISKDTTGVDDLQSANYLIAMATSATPDSGSVVYPAIPRVRKFAGITVFNKIYSGKEIVLFRSRDALEKFIDRMNKDGVVDLISDLFVVPSCLFDLATLGEDFAYDSTEAVDTEKFYFYYPPYSDVVKVINKSVDKNYSFSGYTPKNNKLYCYPYNYLLVTNNVGGTNIYKYEDFSANTCTFDIIGALTIGGSFKLIPRNYKGVNENFDESIPLAKFPTCSWSSDSYINWLTQEATNTLSGGITSIVQGAVAGASTGGGQGAVIGAGITAVGEVFNAIDKFDSSKLLPNQIGGASTGDVTWASGNNNFLFRRMHCKPEYLRIADNYFTRFGYKVNRLKTPNITGRRYFNYVQIASSDDVASGSIPNIYMDEINKAFRKGITIWHDHNSIGNYSVSNTII